MKETEPVGEALRFEEKGKKMVAEMGNVQNISQNRSI